MSIVVAVPRRWREAFFDAGAAVGRGRDEDGAAQSGVDGSADAGGPASSLGAERGPGIGTRTRCGTGEDAGEDPREGGARGSGEPEERSPVLDGSASGVGDVGTADDLGTLAALTGLGTLRVVPQSDPLPADTRVLITGWGAPVLDEVTLAAAPRLALVAHTGGTVKPFVTDAVWRRGIRVTQAGAAMAYPVGEVALAFTLALLHRIPRFDHALHAGAGWARAKAAPPRHELAAGRIGVVGASRTGREYIRLVRLLGATVTVADPYLTEAEAEQLGVRVATLDEVLAENRIVALHAPVLPETRHLLGPRELSLLPDGAGLVNTARSWLVDPVALLAELRSGRIDAAVDVFDDEPLAEDDPLRDLPNVLLTPHEAAGTVEARRRQGDLVIAEIERFHRGEPLRHEVTAADWHRIG
ncbi:phosphoglycerate dehydrogenase-like enzyme [Actinoalloteichus hoggarensis]|uniref:D-3-phosphoglycerate dehydrogenase n=1 Tax=Actinoalloteichus hoggarensis TaxID=1470176 RepID=A0A221W5J9_9PSEU|nr:hydroxyacid dehydrogenase [Actinoalloteichus hoggarensis]ASO20976.1 D-3-phosphoglycerate dehydrogenase [Actinoalloteichus hoggarensis]MBB5920907.1 phosphoglycerate dehydrogenase-like enzyme [Actinoalloteichus hoggarensis]